MKYAVIAIPHSCLSYPSRGAVPDILGHVRLIHRRLSARMSVDEPPTWLDILAEPLHVERSLQCNAMQHPAQVPLLSIGCLHPWAVDIG